MIQVYTARQMNEGEVLQLQQYFNYIDKMQAGFIEHSTLFEGTLE